MKSKQSVLYSSVILKLLLLPTVSDAQEAGEEAQDEALEDDALEDFIYETEVRAERLRRETTRHVLEKDEISKLPGTYGDPLNGVKALPGVARTSGIAGGLIIRGSEPDDTVYLLEGAVIPMIYHFGDVTSIIHSSFIEEVQFYPGNFSVRYGRTTSGVVDIKTRAPTEYGYSASVEADLFDAGATLEGKLSQSWSMGITGRRSYIDGVLKATGLLEDELQFTVAPRYFDFQVMADYHPGTGNTIRIMALGADDKAVTGGDDFLSEDPLDLHASLYRAQVDGTHRIGSTVQNEWELSLSVWRAEQEEGHKNTKVLALPIHLRDELTLFADKPLLLRIGADATIGWGHVEETRSYSNEKTDGDRFHVYPALYSELMMTAVPKCEFIFGVRGDYLSPIDRWTVDPRFTGTFSPFSHTTFKTGIGLFHQPPGLDEMDEDIGNPNLKPTAAIHYSAGIEQVLPMYDKLSINIEVFYKDLRRIVVWSDDWINTVDGTETEGYINGATGRAYGTELEVRLRPTERFFGWIAYTLMKSEHTNNRTDVTAPFEYDQRHILTIAGSVKLGYGISFSGRFRLSSGNPYTPISNVLYNATYDYYQPVWEKENSARLPLYHQLDLRIDKTWQWQPVALSVYLDVQNVYNHDNIKGYFYNHNYSEKRSTRDLPIIPSLGIELEYQK